MSFILDAIAKSERERQQQEIPDARIFAMPVVDSQRPRRNLPYYVAGALLLSIIVLLIWMQSGQPPFHRFLQSENASNEPAVTPQFAAHNVNSLNEISNVEISAPVARITQFADVTSAAPQTAGTGSSIKNTGSMLAPPDRNTVFDQWPIKTKDNAPALVENNQGDLVVKLENEPSLKTTEKRNGNSMNPILIEVNSGSDVNSRVVDKNQTELDPDPRKISSLSELPVDVRRDLPAVSFTGHLYSKNVALSYVMVDGGRSVIAGQQITDELFLHKVTPTGAIVDFRGFLIETGILQNWSLK